MNQETKQKVALTLRLAYLEIKATEGVMDREGPDDQSFRDTHRIAQLMLEAANKIDPMALKHGDHVTWRSRPGKKYQLHTLISGGRRWTMHEIDGAQRSEAREFGTISQIIKIFNRADAITWGTRDAS